MNGKDFLAIDWNDSHISYDIWLGGPIVAYITLSKKYPNCLCLVAGNKDFPVLNTGCGVSRNPTPWDIIQLLEDHPDREYQIIGVVDDKIYDLDASKMDMNGIDGLVSFDMKEITDPSQLLDNEGPDMEIEEIG